MKHGACPAHLFVIGAFMRYKKNQNPFLVLFVFAFIVCSCEDEAIANLLGTSAQSPV
jgi:hypothetical protein